MAENLEIMLDKGIIDSNVREYTKLQTPRELLNEIPVSKENVEFLYYSRRQIKDILDKKDIRKIAIVGPCSIHDVKAGIDYAYKLKILSDKIRDKLLVVMRTYFEKPRTVLGWTGLIDDPCMDESCKTEIGLRNARLFLKEIIEIRLPCATEFVGPIIPQYIGDLISWAAIGARTSESMPHRQLASGLSMPVGFKNSTSGDVSIAVDAAECAMHSHSFIGINLDGNTCIVRTQGNRYSHIVLRGGNGVPNCSSELVYEALILQERAGIPKNIIIDCSHGNSEKKYEKQEGVSYLVLDQIKNRNKDIVGIMLESNLYEGKQDFPKTSKERQNLRYGVSITDGCISWETTERILMKYYKAL